MLSAVRRVCYQLMITRSEHVGDNDENAVYVAILCWVYCKDKSLRLSTLTLLFTHYPSFLSGDQLPPFLSRALERRTFTPQQIVDRFLKLLMDDKILDDNLGMVILALTCFSQHAEMMAARVAQAEMPFALVFAAQRQVCSGAEEHVVRILRIVFRAIGYGANSSVNIPVLIACQNVL